MTTISTTFPATGPTSGTLVTADGRTLPLTAVRLDVRAAAGLAQVRLVQTFQNPFAEPLHVTYQLPLPAEAAVGGFAFTIGELRIVGDIDGRSAARERFEQALASGHTAALLEQDRSSLFTQELGNVPPGAEIEAVIDVDQPLCWQDGRWQWRFPTTVAPRFLGAPGRVGDAGRLAVDVADPAAAPLPPRCELALAIDDVLTGDVQSPSHLLVTGATTARETIAPTGDSVCVTFAAGGGRVAMDRDVVVSWPVAAPAVGLALRTLRGERALEGQAFGLLTLVPPRSDARLRQRQRDLIVLLDISGSMHGAPLAQAQAVTAALIDSLDSEDRLEMIAFASRPTAWQRQPQYATPANKAAAHKWLFGLQASGSTEMHEAILAALASVRAGVQRQVVIVSDGLIGFEQEIVGAIQKGLPAHSRVHAVGVGSAPNRTLTRGASRAGRGLEVLIGIDEDPRDAAQRLLARTAAPCVDELTIAGTAVVEVAPAALPDVFGGAPARLALRLRPEGGTLIVRGATAAGPFVHELQVAAITAGGDAAIGRLFGRELVEDLEVALAAGASAQAIDAQMEAIGLAHRIATRMTSWLAVADQVLVDPQAPQRHAVVPQELPHGMSIDRLGLRRCGSMAFAEECLAMPSSVCAPVPARSRDKSKKARWPSKPTGKIDAESDALREEWDDVAFGGAVPGRGMASEPPVRLRALLRSRGEDGWLFVLEGVADWRVPAKVTVVLADGSEIELAVDVARTTAAGAIPPGAQVRLTLLVEPGMLQPGLLQPGMLSGDAVRLRWLDGLVVLDVPIA